MWDVTVIFRDCWYSEVHLNILSPDSCAVPPALLSGRGRDQCRVHYISQAAASTPAPLQHSNTWHVTCSRCLQDWQLWTLWTGGPILRIEKHCETAINFCLIHRWFHLFIEKSECTASMDNFSSGLIFLCVPATMDGGKSKTCKITPIAKMLPLCNFATVSVQGWTGQIAWCGSKRKLVSCLKSQASCWTWLHRLGTGVAG